MKPPALAAWLVALRVDPGEREFALGDLEEEFREIAAAKGARAARQWYWRQALRTAGSAPALSLHGEERRPSLAGNAFRDLRLALRAIPRAPGASAAAILTYALGLGANLAIFSVAWPVLVSPLPFPDESRLVSIWLTYPVRNTTETNPISMGDFVDISTATRMRVAAFSGRLTDTNMTAGGEPRRFRLGHATPAFFDVMGIRTVAGRVFQDADGAQGAARVLVITERTWRTHFGADPAITGRIVRLDGDPFEIVGVVPNTAGYGTIEPDGWSALSIPASRDRLRAYFLRGVGRLHDHVTIEQANDELRAIMSRAAIDFPESNRTLGAQAFPFREEVTGGVRRPLLILSAGSLLLLLVAAVNLSGLLVARNVQRAREMGIRVAIGASRARLMMQMLVEQLVLACAGGAAGLAVAAIVLDLMGRIAPEGALHPDRQVSTPALLLCTLLLAIVAGLLVAVLPSWRASRPAGTAWSARGASASRAMVRARATVVSAQIALTVLLLIVASLIGTSLYRVMHVDPGFSLDSGLVADIKLPQTRYSSATAATAFFERLLDRSASLPGVRGACVINQMPLEPAMGSMTWVAEGDTRMVSSSPKSVSEGCFSVLGVPLLRGRLPAAREREPSIAISQSMARALFRDGRDPIGRRAHMGLKSGPLMTIIGIVGDVRDRSLDTRSLNQVWLPQSSGMWWPERLVLHTSVAPASVAPSLRALLRELDPELAVANVRTIGEIVGRSTASRRFMSLLMGLFAGVAVLLSAVGIYGVLAHLVGQRTREIGIRRALGATSAHITRVVTGSIGVSIVAGSIAGIAAAYAASTLVASLLYEVSPRDPRVYLAVAAFVAAIAIAASWAPARRATRIEPMRALSD